MITEKGSLYFPVNVVIIFPRLNFPYFKQSTGFPSPKSNNLIMKITQNNINDLQAELKVVITPEDYQEKVDKELKNYRKNAEIPGFRKGKVPNDVLEQKYGQSIHTDVVNDLIQSSYPGIP